MEDVIAATSRQCERAIMSHFGYRYYFSIWSWWKYMVARDDDDTRLISLVLLRFSLLFPSSCRFFTRFLFATPINGQGRAPRTPMISCLSLRHADIEIAHWCNYEKRTARYLANLAWITATLSGFYFVYYLWNNDGNAIQRYLSETSHCTV